MTAPRVLLVAIPCLNEAETLGAVIARVPSTIVGFDEVRILVVDDGSTDRTREIALAAGAQVISHGENRGVGAAFQTMLAHAVARGVAAMVNLDGDGQFAPEDVRALVAPIVDGTADFVSASRFKDPTRTPATMPPLKRWGNQRMSALVSRFAGRTFHDVSCGFRAYGREALLHLNLHARFTYTQETFLDLASKGLRICEVPVDVQYFPGRTSRVANNLLRYAARTATIIFRLYRDYHPLRFFWALAGTSTFAGLSLLALLLAHWLATGRFYGQIWAGLSGASLLFVGLVFFIVGLTADMLDRIRVNQERILYLLKQRAVEDLASHGSDVVTPEVRRVA